MCGILGTLPALDENDFLSILDTLRHRGPDGYGVWTDDNHEVTLGHRRLSILDLSKNGKQPMAYGRYMITFNGEIFNFVELKEELIKKGHQFYNDTDTEVILACYQAYGEKCVEKFNGMWAFAIWDKESKKLFIARDRFGIKPLFYAFIGGRFVFASEMKAIFPFLPELKPSADFDWCHQNLFEYEQTDKCLIEGIKRFPAGNYAFLNLQDKKLRLTKYWETLDHLVEVPRTYEEQVERFRELFFDSCKIRMRSDVSLGTSLSGGLDSSSVISAMANINDGIRVSRDWQHAFVATFPGTKLDETHYAKMVAEHLGVKATYHAIDPVKGLSKLEDYLYMQEDLYLTSPIPMMDHYARLRENGIVVSMDGHGADEMFSGYSRSHFFLGVQDNPFSPKAINTVFKLYDGLVEDDVLTLEKKQGSFKDKFKFKLDKNLDGATALAKAYAKRMLNWKEYDYQYNQKIGRFNEYLYILFHHTILPTLLRNYDRYSMANGIEMRMPFMDYRLVSYVFSLPWMSKMKEGYTKSVLRHAMDPYMPKEITWRRSKVGFNTPFSDWMKGSWKEYLLDMIESSAFHQSNLIDSKQVKKQVEYVIHNPAAAFYDGEKAWCALIPYWWEQAVLKRRTASPIL